MKFSSVLLFWSRRMTWIPRVEQEKRFLLCKLSSNHLNLLTPLLLTLAACVWVLFLIGTARILYFPVRGLLKRKLATYISRHNYATLILFFTSCTVDTDSWIYIPLFTMNGWENSSDLIKFGLQHNTSFELSILPLANVFSVMVELCGNPRPHTHITM